MPPKTMVTKDFLRQVLKEDKKLLKMTNVKFINVPKYDELSVTNLMPKVAGNAEFMAYMPDKLPKGKQIGRDYFMNVFNTLYQEHMKRIVEHANS